MILVTGGTGLVGGHLLYRFRESAEQITAIYRDKEQLEKTRYIFESYGQGQAAFVDQFNWIQAELLDIPSLDRAMQGIQQVYHCAASLKENHFEVMKAINMRGTENLINLALSKGVKKFCHVSSIAALGDPIGQSEVTEEDYFNLDGEHTDYAITKFGAEMEAWRATQENMQVIIVNPGVILGEGNWQQGSGQLFGRTANGNLFYTSGGSGFIDVRDVVRCMQWLMENNVKNERFILVSRNLKYKDLLSEIAKQLKVKPPRILLPKWLVQLASAFLKIPDLLGFPRRLSSATVTSLYSTTSYSNEKIQQLIPFTLIPLEESIQRISTYYRR
ncbi:NAD-dependent epimerase/dehydratase family protein [Nonlabens xiamenensis]|uniref:NAD-dependent epimerase/dehydratase family protein n=1 Tax=Nonlabens xiamenensis TaxID=2341043 RepID=UPI000F61277F|nr:NAD-dependent epimerase/dehydratase family protein [Nonlabens xiamenensis]